MPAPPRREADPRRRRALTHVGGPVACTGDAALSAVLASALDVQSALEDEEHARAHVHGFHSYPARMHPTTARRLVEGLSQPGAAVLDPFCGSGTVLVEARLAGRRALGVDANPLAVRLARLKVRGVPAEERTSLLEGAERVAAVATARRKAKSGASRRYGHEDVALFEPHVLLELDSLRVGLEGLDHRGLREDLELVLSSLLTKVSRRAADTSEHAAPRRIAAGYPTRLFVKKTEELCARLAEVEPELRAAPAPRVVEGDARDLRAAGMADVDLALTSPPYPGVYDYLAHHAARLRWLRLSPARFDAAEIGARRRLEPLGPAEGRRAWERELGAVLGSLRAALRPSARAVLLLADSVVAGMAVSALDALARAAKGAGLEIAAAASQERPHFHGPTAKAFRKTPRREHAVVIAPR